MASALCCFVLLLRPGAAHAVSVDQLERDQVSTINRYRVANGLGRLTIDVKLTRTAEWMSADMPRYNYFSHSDHLGRDPFARLAHFGYPTNSWRGENLAAGYADVASTFTQWKNSPGHRANMVNRNYTAIGIARVHSPTSTYGYYWVTEFGSKVTRRVASGAALNRFPPAARTDIRRTAIRCLHLRRRGATWRRMNCAWNVRTARRLSMI